jgi:hypothetical protein
MLAVTGALSHEKLASTRNLESGVPMLSSLPYFIEGSQNVDLQL